MLPSDQSRFQILDDLLSHQRPAKGKGREVRKIATASTEVGKGQDEKDVRIEISEQTEASDRRCSDISGDDRRAIAEESPRRHHETDELDEIIAEARQTADLVSDLSSEFIRQSS